MQYFVDFTHGDKSKVIYKTDDKAEAIAFAKRKQAKYKATGRSGILSVYEITGERGEPMQKCFEFFEV